MAHRVVDQFEAIEIEEEHGEHRVLTAPGTLSGIGQPLHEQRPVGKPSERIVKCVVAILLLPQFSLRQQAPQVDLAGRRAR
jgi:hypothetical protein